eukprot:gb/GECG01015464.1/.p1 GENE.gb/GECG01015464.1/~~gb/GECG01015464.1/.p1  ORF type:complete len:194 (+),score=13.77 gb/GECG01015464.1/:1-582(+)
MQSNQLHKLTNSSFDGLDNLLHLYLSNNEIGSLHEGTFYGLRDLELLNLDGNNITAVEESSFRGLDNLETLNIGYNPLGPSLSLKLFDPVRDSLRSIYLAHMKLQYLPFGIFEGIHFRRRVFFAGRFLSENPGAFDFESNQPPECPPGTYFGRVKLGLPVDFCIKPRPRREQIPVQRVVRSVTYPMSYSGVVN